jgi:hypothetical protein
MNSHGFCARVFVAIGIQLGVPSLSVASMMYVRPTIPVIRKPAYALTLMIGADSMANHPQALEPP